MILNIKDIKIANRYRKDMGNLQELAESIKEQGLLQSIGVTENNELVFGERRIEACKILGYETIEARIVNVTSIVEGELTENEIRKQFNIQEKIEIGKVVENVLGERQGQRNDLKLSDVCHTVEKGRTSDITAKKIGFGSGRTYDRAKKIVEKANVEQLEKVNSGEKSINKVYSEIKKEEQTTTAKIKIAKEYEHNTEKPKIIHGDFTNFKGECDLLITDPPYMTDVEDINEFAKWLPEKLKCVKDTGFAFIFIGGYPQELNAYLNLAMPEQVLIWTFRNTLGAAPKNKYKLNYQAILFFRMQNSPELNCPLTNELWAVQDVNAPDGRHSEGRYHAWEKPMDLAERLIRHTTKVGDTILDCFAGTGTFLLAASKLGRKNIGYEINADMIKIAKQRGCEIEKF